MTGPDPTPSDPGTATVWREYRISLVLLGVGVVLFVTTFGYSAWASSTGNYPASFWPGLILSVAPTAGGMLVLLAGTIAYFHRSYLRDGRHPG